MHKIKSRPKTSTAQRAQLIDTSSYWNSIQQQYGGQNDRITKNIEAVAAVISNETCLSYSLQQQSHKYEWYTMNGRYEMKSDYCQIS